MANKPRIVITIVTKGSISELSIVKGREMASGKICAGPTEKQYKLAYKAITDLCSTPAGKKKR